MDHKRLRLTENVFFPLLTNAMHISLVKSCDMNARIGTSFWTHKQTEANGQMDGQTEMEVEIVTYLDLKGLFTSLIVFVDSTFSKNTCIP